MITKIAALRIELKCRELVEGTNLQWWECLKCNGSPFKKAPFFNNREEFYEVAVALIHGKPAFKNDTLYFIGSKLVKPRPIKLAKFTEGRIIAHDGGVFIENDLSWTTIKQEVNLTIDRDVCEDVIAYVERFEKTCKEMGMGISPSNSLTQLAEKIKISLENQ